MERRSSKHPLRKRKIFVIEDNPQFAILIQRTLESKYFEAQIFSDGAAGLVAARSTRPDLIILDLGVPKFDGFQVLKVLRSEPELASIPVLAITGLPDPQRILKSAADAMRANCFLYKPFPLSSLRSAVAGLVKGIETPRVSERLVASRGALRVDIAHKKVYFNGDEVPFRSLNGLLILALLAGAQEPISRETLLHEVWPEGENFNTVDTAIHRLNADLSKRNLPIAIEGTGHGYRLVDVTPG